MSWSRRVGPSHAGLTLLLVVASAGGAAKGGEVSSPAADVPSFVRDVRPILADHCFACHGPDENRREADLRLDRPPTVEGVIRPGAAEASELVRRVTSDDVDLLMPPPSAHKPLTAKQIELLRRWIDEGAAWSDHWSWSPLVRPALPAAPPDGAMPLHGVIDRFVRQRLKDVGLSPAPEANRETLIRRVTLDLIGLPPTPAEVDAFVADSLPAAYERLVDRLLASPAFGERMAWDWLDAARYADSNGYQGDRERTMWPWRDWVVEALNQDLAFDEFTVWQLAGDLLPEASERQRLATGFCRNHMINGEGGRIAEENRVDYVMDMAETTATVWLGLTLNCCRCHDHKFDPLTRQDYYSLFAFFNQTPVDGSGGDPQTPPVLEVPTRRQQVALQQLDQQLAALQRKGDATGQRRSADGWPEQREALEQRREQLRREIPRVMVMADLPQRRTTFLLERGLYNQPGAPVPAGVPASLPPLDTSRPADRLTLARWLVADTNPLTARVIVNRHWQQLFGVGLVKTSEDFGVQGEIPIQMDLLNWLACEFRASGWDLKLLLRRIVTSHTYRQSSAVNEHVWQTDPENRWLSRGARFRLPAWMIRDQALAASGLLVHRMGGPGVNPYQPAGVWEEATFGNKRYQASTGADLYRRSVYTFWRRIIAPTMFFDSATRQTCAVRSARTNTPLHALATFNDVTYVEAARQLAESTLQATFTSDRERLDFVYRRLLARRTSAAERAVLLPALARARGEFAEDASAAARLLGHGSLRSDPRPDAVELASWTSLCLAVLNLDETLTKE